MVVGTAQKLKGKKKGSHKPLTFQDLMQIGLGQLRLSPSAFYEITVQEIVAAMHGAAEVEERAYQQQWTQTRWLASLLLQPHTKNKIKPQDLCTFPWENTEKLKQSQNKQGIALLKQLSKNGTA